MWDDEFLGNFLGIATIGIAFFLGNKVGQHRANHKHNEIEREREINELKKQIEYLKIQQQGR
mgnify:CR=1 FL=1